ncbi:MAG: LexA family protein [Candidatus Saccharibacteria bacterium]
MNEEQTHEGVSVHAGFPNPAADKSLGNLDIHQLLVPRPASTFLFRIAGDQWQDMGIFNGDIAVIDRALDAHERDLVVWWHEEVGEFSISHFKKMPPEARMWGIVTSTVHQFRTS